MEGRDQTEYFPDMDCKSQNGGLFSEEDAQKAAEAEEKAALERIAARKLKRSKSKMSGTNNNGGDDDDDDFGVSSLFCFMSLVYFG